MENGHCPCTWAPTHTAGIGRVFRRFFFSFLLQCEVQFCHVLLSSSCLLLDHALFPSSPEPPHLAEQNRSCSPWTWPEPAQGMLWVWPHTTTISLAPAWESCPFLGKACCSRITLAQQRSSSLWRDLAAFKMKSFLPLIHMNSCTPLLTSPLPRAGEQTESFPGAVFNKNNKTDLRGSRPHRKTHPFQKLELWKRTILVTVLFAREQIQALCDSQHVIVNTRNCSISLAGNTNQKFGTKYD